jgi:hypothetical protein
MLFLSREGFLFAAEFDTRAASGIDQDHIKNASAGPGS